MLADLILRNGNVVNHNSTTKADVAIKDGHVVGLGSSEVIPKAKKEIDCEGLHLLPGAIDVHVHFRVPGYAYKEDWQTGTAAAAMGGVTTVFDMPNTNPPTRNIERLREKQELARDSFVDFGIYGLLADDNIDDLIPMSQNGVNAFKCFMGNTFGDLPSPSTGAMLQAFEILAPTGMRISLHAETASIMAHRQKLLELSKCNDPLHHVDARPDIVAIEAVSRAAVLAEWTGARIHILHISSKGELEPLMAAKKRGVDITGETCPCYLLLKSEDYKHLKTGIRVNPPVRSLEDMSAIWQALNSGLIDMVATDHAPHLPNEKMKSSIWEADCGFPGVETQMPLMLTQVNRDKLSLQTYVDISSTRPSKGFGLWPLKGQINVGCHADIAVVDLNRKEIIKSSGLHSKSKFTPFDGFQVKGAPIHTLVRGEFIQFERTLVAEKKGFGRQVTDIQKMPKPSPKNQQKYLSSIIKKTY